MQQLGRTLAAAVVAVVAAALVAMLVPSAAAGAPRRPRDHHCADLPRERIVDVLSERVTCRVALTVVRTHVRSAKRRGACDPARRSGSCMIEPFECVARTFDDIGTRVICFARGDKKVTFRYAPPGERVPGA